MSLFSEVTVRGFLFRGISNCLSLLEHNKLKQFIVLGLSNSSWILYHEGKSGD